MTNDQYVEAIIQHDINHRGLRTRPDANLVTASVGDLGRLADRVASAQAVCIVTGFTVPAGDPPSCETDGPLGALFLARALTPAGVRVSIAADGSALPALAAGLAACGLDDRVPVATIPGDLDAYGLPIAQTARERWMMALSRLFAATGFADGLIALERVGPSHTPESLALSGASPAERARFQAEVPLAGTGRCYSMRGLDVTDRHQPAHLLFETFPGVQVGGLWTAGIGDGGNEIGMGNVPWNVVRRNVPNGGVVACRVKTDYLITAGVSNWGAYGLATLVRGRRGITFDAALYDEATELRLLQTMVEAGPLVDGVAGTRTATVDGLAFDRYAAVLNDLARLAWEG